MYRAVATLALIAALSLVPASSAPAAPVSDGRLDRALEKLVSLEGGPPGASVFLRRAGRQRFLTAGVGDLETERPFRADKRMRIASVSKAFSGAVMLSLVEAGVLSLDDTLAQRLPSAPAEWGAVTLRQVASHTGGIPSFTKDPGYLERFSMDLHGQLAMPELVAFVADEPLRYAPGSGYEYSNTDNIVMALVAEAATGRSYDELLAAEVFEPLGLSRTRLPAGFRLPGPKIHGYEVLPTEDLTECCSMDFVSASGGLYSTPRELTRFVRGYVAGELFGGDARAAQFQFREGGGSEPPGPGRNSAGLALFRYQTPCGTVFGHTGNFPGYTQFTASTRSGRRALTFSVNRQLAPDAVGERAVEVFEVLRRDYRLAVCALLGRGPGSS
ncbi:MAG: serine hydrolase domain-containing protein [Solirubrobacterales bacterium]